MVTIWLQEVTKDVTILKKQLIALGLGLTLLTGMAGAKELPGLTVDNTAVSAVAYVENGTTYVSLRLVGEVLDPEAYIAWENGRAVVRAEGLTLTAVPGQQWVEANGRYLYVPGGVRLQGGRVLLPVRVLADAFGARVEWNGSGGQISVRSGQGATWAGYDADALYWLSRIISAESKGESLAGQIAVGNVVLNRVRKSEFPNTIYGVIFDDRWGGQFEPVRNGTIYQTPTEQSVIAAKLCLEGADVAGESLYFLDPIKAGNLWTTQNRPYIMTIGVHDFYG